MQADPTGDVQVDTPRSASDRIGLVLMLGGAGFALLAALLLWQSQGAAIFLSAATNAVVACF